MSYFKLLTGSDVSALLRTATLATTGLKNLGL